MLMYNSLQVPKETVRACNAVLNIFQFRIIAYALHSMFTRQDAPAYAAASLAYCVGMVAGDRLAQRIDQQVFGRVLVGLMFLCCVLMFVSAAGLTSPS